MNYVRRADQNLGQPTQTHFGNMNMMGPMTIYLLISCTDYDMLLLLLIVTYLIL